MSGEKQVLVQLGSYNRVVTLDVAPCPVLLNEKRYLPQFEVLFRLSKMTLLLCK